MCDTTEEFSKYSARYYGFINNLLLKIELLEKQDDEFFKDIFLESILSDVRAMLTENKKYKNNFTIQNDFRRFDKVDGDYVKKNNNLEFVASQIDEYLETEIFGEGLIFQNITIREAIKFYVDKFIAHHDFANEAEYEKKDKLRKIFLDSPIFSISMIVKTIIGYAEKSKKEIIASTLSALTCNPEDITEQDYEND